MMGRIVIGYGIEDEEALAAIRDENEKNLAVEKSNREIRNQLCGEDCRKCPVLCGFGKEAIKRGILPKYKPLPMMEKTPPETLLVQPEEEFVKRKRPEGTMSMKDMAQKWGVSIAAVRHYIDRMRIEPVCWCRTGRCPEKVYREEEVLRMILDYLGQSSTERSKTIAMKYRRLLEAV